MTSMIAREVKGEYERRANALLAAGHLGHGVQEDLLIEAASWFHEKLVRRGGALADFFAAALDHHVALYFAVALDDEQAAADLHGFLQVVLYWLRALPEPVVRKSPEPLGLIVGYTGTGHNLGAQIMRPSGPSLIYWRIFRNLCGPTGKSYWEFSEQIRQTLVHELIGHQLAFCTPAGSLIPRSDLSDIFSASGIEYLKLRGAPAIHVDRFLESQDLLEAVQQIQYFASRHDMHKYHSNLTELIAFAVEGCSPSAGLPYARILEILKRNFLCAREPVGKVISNHVASQRALYRGFDLSSKSFPPYYVERSADGACTETRAVLKNGHWLTELSMITASQEGLCCLDEAATQDLDPGQEFFLRFDIGGYLLKLERSTFLASCFGLQHYGTRTMRLDPIKGDEFQIECTDRRDGLCGGIKMQNMGMAPLQLKLLKLEMDEFVDVESASG